MTTADLASIIRDYTGSVVAEMKAEIASLRAELQAKSMAYDQMDVVIRGLVSSAVAALPTAKDGEPGPIGPMGPPGEAGRDGQDGKDGTAGLNGKDGEQGTPGMVGPMGLTGPEGARGEKGDTGERGEIGLQGKDGIGLAAALIGQDGQLVVTCSDGSIKTLGVVIGKDGAPGRDGSDGIGIAGKDGAPGRDGTLDQLKIERIDERTIAFCFKDGTPIEGGTLTLNHPVFQDTYHEDAVYKAGDLVQWDGSGWIALKDHPPMKPGSGTSEVSGWKLWIKKGRDGKKGEDGKNGLDGKNGRDGKDRW